MYMYVQRAANVVGTHAPGRDEGLRGYMGGIVVAALAVDVRGIENVMCHKNRRHTCSG